MVNNAAEAEDLTQEAFLQLHRKIATFRGDSAFSTWLHRLSINVVLMHLRRKGLQVVSLDEAMEPSPEDGPGRSFGAPERADADRQVIQRERAEGKEQRGAVVNEQVVIGIEIGVDRIADDRHRTGATTDTGRSHADQCGKRARYVRRGPPPSGGRRCIHRGGGGG